MQHARILEQRRSSRTKNREDKCKDRFLEEQLANTEKERFDLAGKSLIFERYSKAGGNSRGEMRFFFFRGKKQLVKRNAKKYDM